MADSLSRRGLLAGLVGFCVASPALAGPPEAFEDPFLGRAALGDLILAPNKTRMADVLPDHPRFFGIVRKTNVLTAAGGADTINMLELFAAFSGENCHVTLCSAAALQRSTNAGARPAYDALRAVARRVRKRPDAVYDIKDIESLKATACTKSGSMIASL